MDCSGLLQILVHELQTHKGLALENHLYGCLSLWEQWAEGELALIDGKGAWDDTTFDIHKEEDWSQMGPTFGFVEDSPAYTGSSAYRDAWRSVFTSVDWKDLERVDAVEEPLFAQIGELGLMWLQAALPTGELPEGFVPSGRRDVDAEAGAGAEAKTKRNKRGGAAAYKKTRRTHGRRSLTPVHCHHTLQMTRRQKHIPPYL
jgi:hypothetical protein